MKEKSGMRLRNPIFNTAVESIYKPETNRVNAWETSTNHLSTFCMEKNEYRVKHARRSTALNVLLGMLGAIMDLDNAAKEDTSLALTVVRYNLIGRDCDARTGHNDFEVQKTTKFVVLRVGFRLRSKVSVCVPLAAFQWTLSDACVEKTGRAITSKETTCSKVFYFRQTRVPLAR